MLLFDCFSNGQSSLQDQYEQQRMLYENGNTYILLNLNKVFGPYPKGSVPWDISLEQKYAQSKELKDVLEWVNKNIVLQLGKIDRTNNTRTTYGVLLRIATGMLNKVNIPQEYKTIFHRNMTQNIRNELSAIIEEALPF